MLQHFCVNHLCPHLLSVQSTKLTVATTVEKDIRKQDSSIIEGFTIAVIDCYLTVSLDLVCRFTIETCFMLATRVTFKEQGSFLTSILFVFLTSSIRKVKICHKRTV